MTDALQEESLEEAVALSNLEKAQLLADHAYTQEPLTTDQALSLAAVYAHIAEVEAIEDQTDAFSSGVSVAASHTLIDSSQDPVGADWQLEQDRGLQ